MKLTKLDGRHTGWKNWKYFVDLPFNSGKINERKAKFNQMREWCWTTWGPSKELTDYDHYDLFDGEHSSNPSWCWVNDEHGRRRIYLRDDGAAEIFTLRWL